MPQTDFSPTEQEQLLLELVNQARMYPEQEFSTFISNAATDTAVQSNISSAIRYFGVDLDAFSSQMAAYSAVSPLAWNSALGDAANDHSLAMIAADTQSHQLPGELGLSARISAAGYSNMRTVSENVYTYAEDVLYAHAGFMIDWGYDTADFSGNSLLSNWASIGDGMQDAAGHRATVLSADVTEVGMSIIAETNASTSVGPVIVTQDFATRYDYEAQIVGVVINDADGDAFYDIGEGMGGVTVTATGATGTFTTQTWDAGGYQMVLPNGSYTVSFSGGSLVGVARYSVTMGDDNIKLDALAADAKTLTSVTGTTGPDVLTGDAGSNTLNGLAGNDTLYGADGADTLIGGTGDDFLYGGSTAADLRDVMYGGDGNDTLDGGYGNDELRGDAGNDILSGGFGADTVIGGTGNDALTGGALGDLLYGGDGNDFLNGGFGFDRLNGGAGADTFYHMGIRDHGSDWIQDYSAADGDVLQFGGAATTSADDFLIQRAITTGAGAAGVAEVFVTQISTGTLLWALVDGAAQTEINIQIGAQVFDLLA